MPIHLPSKALENASRKLQKVLTAPTEGGIIRRQTRGRIDARRVHRAPQGQTDFRKRKWVRDEFTTAVTIVLDFSSSMDTMMPVMQASTRALCKMLERSGNPYNVYGFAYSARCLGIEGLKRQPSSASHGDRRHDVYGEEMKPRSQGNYEVRDRHEHMATLWEIIGERDTMRQCEDNLRKISYEHANSGTPDAAALVGGIQINAAMKADRHIVIMMTDGDGYGSRYIKAATKYANSLGVETVGVALNCNHITEGDGQYNASATAWCQRHTGGKRVVEAADKLTKGFFESLTKQLGKGVTRKSRVMLS